MPVLVSRVSATARLQISCCNSTSCQIACPWRSATQMRARLEISTEPCIHVRRIESFEQLPSERGPWLLSWGSRALRTTFRRKSSACSTARGRIFDSRSSTATTPGRKSCPTQVASCSLRGAALCGSSRATARAAPWRARVSWSRPSVCLASRPCVP